VSLPALIDRDGDVCVWCGRRPWPGDLTTEHLLPFVRSEVEAGRYPRVDLLEPALERLSASASREHAEYGRRQLALLRRIGDRVSP
jgi:hypothetical protein